MGEGSRARSRSGFRRSRRLRASRRGVVAVIGTLLALLVFFALFGVFITQYVPLWMEDNESLLSSQVQGSLALLKSGVDDQYLFGGIQTYSVPFTLSSASVPLFAQPTVATLAYLTGCSGGFNATTGAPVHAGACDYEAVSYTSGPGGSGSQSHPYSWNVATNYLEVVVPNRYFTPGTYFFENDGVTAAQNGFQQWMVVAPPLNVTKSQGTVSVMSSQVVLLGSPSTFTAGGSKEVTSTLLTNSSVSSANRFLTAAGAARTFNVTLTLGVHEVCAWYNLLYNMTYAALGPASSSTWNLTGSWSPSYTAPSTTVCEQSISSSLDLTLKVFNVNYASSFVAQDQVSFNVGGL